MHYRDCREKQRESHRRISIERNTYLQHDAGGAANLSGLAFLVNLAQAGPFAELLVGIDTDQWNLVLVAQGRDQLLVLRLVAALGQNAQHGLAFVERLARFVNTVHQSVGDQRLLEHLLEGGVDIHRAIDGRTRGFTVTHGAEEKDNETSVNSCTYTSDVG